ncbi:MAG: UDP diphospho-muramoyl pentapeptide beta-N acetylglucosaminyl transferase [Parcubacteria group bacterium Gr01-1014_17]|nr:MAG: UDP diphospho-muramoyl pentapeptide beta-N acetylglucosaminyl transferase [Parcubacteria group bacterium Gr01-1014_17]
MKIVFTGGGTGGHFYPIIAVAEEVRALAREKRLVEPQLYFFSPDPCDAGLLAKHNIIFVQTPAGKLRRYTDKKNIIDAFTTAWGVVKTLWLLFYHYTDVVFGKGGYGSFPTLLAARILRIPVVIHESDSVPGRVNRWAGKFAARIAVSFADAAQFFPPEKTAWTGHPVRKALLLPSADGARIFLKLEANVPVLLVLGGSQGAQAINELILSSLSKLTEQFQIIHQTGKENLAEAAARGLVILEGSGRVVRYHPFAFLDEEALRMAASAASLAVSRAGSTIFEIAVWGLPSIVIPITESNGDHQRKNAYVYAENGAAAVLEETNLSPALFLAEIAKIMGDEGRRAEMARAARAFAKQDAALVIAEKLLEIGLSHEK